MESYHKSTYGDMWAEHYDDLFPPPQEDVLDFVESRAGGGPILELAIGSGRMAIPILARGLQVHGIEISPKMLEQLRSRPGGAEVPIVASDMTDFSLEERYPLALLVFNTLFAVQDGAQQADVFRSVAGALSAGGSFVIEAFVPDLGRFDRGQTVRTRQVSVDQVVVEYSVHHPAEQKVDSVVEVRRADGTFHMLPVPIRYLFPDQIDTLAAAAGLQPTERYQWYDESPFTHESPTHVTVYRKQGGEG